MAATEELLHVGVVYWHFPLIYISSISYLNTSAIDLMGATEYTDIDCVHSKKKKKLRLGRLAILNCL